MTATVLDHSALAELATPGRYCFREADYPPRGRQTQ